MINTKAYFSQSSFNTMAIHASQYPFLEKQNEY